MNDIDALRAYICRKFAENVGLTEDLLFGEDLPLSEVMKRSERIHNSVDLMEAFARTANALRKDYGIRVRLPTLPLDTPISRVLTVFLDEARPKMTAAQAVGG